MDTESGTTTQQRAGRMDSKTYYFTTFNSSLNIICHTLIGIVVGVIVTYGLTLPSGKTKDHIILCVLGYQLLMAQAILSLSPHNGWSVHLKLVDKKRAHWILQTVGSALAIVGSFLKIVDKNVHWNTNHGIFALIALVFTVISLVNGLTSLYAYEFRRFLPSTLSKLTHICAGTIAFVASCISLCYGIDKGMFTNWVGSTIANILIGFSSFFTFLIITTPLITFFNKLKNT
ncbi:uncharacterized protein LOC111356551 [Spodoptera litura]|uniref:ascorbate ferrireductase (transmembrane) n=1 Tax=Spodoptera litura TaxID=69820 RepID=A0A9J7EDQ1_SPOLT|nr:uncharacterized protein LOC111356551 [Spodoptera litura]